MSAPSHARPWTLRRLGMISAPARSARAWVMTLAVAPVSTRASISGQLRCSRIGLSNLPLPLSPQILTFLMMSPMYASSITRVKLRSTAAARQLDACPAVARQLDACPAAAGSLDACPRASSSYTHAVPRLRLVAVKLPEKQLALLDAEVRRRRREGTEVAISRSRVLRDAVARLVGPH